MSKASIFKGQANRDDNEPLIIKVIEAYHVEYSQGKPGDGYDLLVQVQPMMLIEVKNPERKWTLTQLEKAKMLYCRARSIPYHVIEYSDQMSDVLSAHFMSGGR